MSAVRIGGHPSWESGPDVLLVRQTDNARTLASHLWSGLTEGADQIDFFNCLDRAEVSVVAQVHWSSASIPCSPSGEFEAMTGDVRANSSNWTTLPKEAMAEMERIPCIFPVEQGIRRRDEFASDWLRPPLVASLLTELGVVLVLRTRGPAWRSRPSALLPWTALAAAAFALAATEMAKRWFFREGGGPGV